MTFRPGTYKVTLRCSDGERREKVCSNNCRLCMWRTVSWQEKIEDQDTIRQILSKKIWKNP